MRLTRSPLILLIVLLALPGPAWSLSIPSLSVPPLNTTLAAPEAPEILSINAFPGSYTCTVQWEDRSDTETGFIVERSYAGGAWEVVATVEANDTTAQDTPERNRICKYRVKAFSSFGSSEYSAPAIFNSAPNTPVSVKAEPGPGPGDGIMISWQKAPEKDSVTSWYQINRVEPGKPNSLRTLKHDSDFTAYTDLTAVPGVTYQYQVVACSSGGISEPTAPVSFRLLNKPAHAFAGIFPGTSSLSVSWTDSSADEDGFLVEYLRDGADPDTVKSVIAKTDSTSVSIPVDNTVSWYVRVSAIADDGSQSVGAVAYHKGPEPIPLQNAPQKLRQGNALGRILLQWDYLPSYQLKFQVERKEPGGTFETIAEVGMPSTENVVTYEDQSAEAGVKYVYRVKAVNPISTSPYSNELTCGLQSLMPLTKPASEILLTIGSAQMTADGSTVPIDSSGAVTPLISEKGRTLIPIRALAEALGGTVGWDPDRKQITVTLEGRQVVMTVGQGAATVNNATVPLEEPPQIREGRTLVPLRFVVENLGLQVNWDAATQTIRIQK